jgi:hypothetical protein
LQVHVSPARVGWVQVGSGTNPRLRDLRPLHLTASFVEFADADGAALNTRSTWIRSTVVVTDCIEVPAVARNPPTRQAREAPRPKANGFQCRVGTNTPSNARPARAWGSWA